MTLDVLEPTVRCIVAERLGVDADELAPDVSLTDELAADSLDLVDMALGLEAELGIVIPDAVFDAVRSYGDLVGAVATAVGARETAADLTAFVWARIVSPHAADGHFHYAGALTPYSVETIADSALHAGAGTHLELSVSETVTDEGMAEILGAFARLGGRGVEVTVHREHRVAAMHRGAAA